MRAPRWAANAIGPAGALIRRRRGLAGLVAGTALGVVLTLLAGTLLPRPAPDGVEPGKIHLVISSGVDDGFGGQRDELIRQWNALYGDRMSAEIQPIRGGADQIRAGMLGRAQAGGAGVDIYNLDVTWMAEFAESGYLRPLTRDGLDLDGFLRQPLATCERDGKLWGLPFNTDAGLLYYRRDLLGDKPDVPDDDPDLSSWQAVDDAARGVLGDPARRGTLEAGYTGQLGDYEGESVNVFEAVWAAGGEVVRDGRVVIDEPQGRAALKRLATGLRQRPYPLVLPASRGFMETEATQAFRDGKVIFMRNWPVAYLNLVRGDSPKPLDFGIAPLPGGSVLGGQNLAIAAGSKHPRAAQKLIEFLTSPRSQQILFERGGFAATREIVYRDREVIKNYQYAEILLEAIEQARLRPDTRHYSLFSEVLRREVNRALDDNGELPEGAADRLTEALHGVQAD